MKRGMGKMREKKDRSVEHSILQSCSDEACSFFCIRVARYERRSQHMPPPPPKFLYTEPNQLSTLASLGHRATFVIIISKGKGGHCHDTTEFSALGHYDRQMKHPRLVPPEYCNTSRIK